MSELFLEIIIQMEDWEGRELDDRHDLEEMLDSALQSKGLGEISGGGSGMGEFNIDVDIHSAKNFDTALEIIRHTLVSENLPRSTKIILHGANPTEYSVYPNVE